METRDRVLGVLVLSEQETEEREGSEQKMLRDSL